MSLSGESERGALVDFRSSWGSPGRWRVNLCTPDRRYVFAPLETCEVQERGVAEPRTISPDEFDARFKPGFYAQARLFLETIDEGRPPAGCDLESVRPAMTLAERLTEACLAGETEQSAATEQGAVSGPARDDHAEHTPRTSRRQAGADLDPPIRAGDAGCPLRFLRRDRFCLFLRTRCGTASI